jgi:hypothetical protein
MSMALYIAPPGFVKRALLTAGSLNRLRVGACPATWLRQ